MGWLFLLLVLLPLAYSIYFLNRLRKNWENLGVDYSEKTNDITNNTSFADTMLKIYNMFPTRRYIGYYSLTRPSVFIRDPELIKLITVKDFDHFMDHQHFIWEENDPLWSKNLFSLKGKKWREMRTTLGPTFTGTKIKYMFTLVQQNGEQFVKHFLDKNEDVTVVEMKDIFTRFTNDVISSCAFGVECDSLSQPENEFYLMSKLSTDFGGGIRKTLSSLCYFLMPSVSRFLNISLFPPQTSRFFNSVVKNVIKTRLEHGIVRPDMINILLEARKHGFREEAQESDKYSKIKDFTDDDITSQALAFIFAGFDVVASMMCYMAYELGLNPDIQKRLIQEIDQTFEDCNGELTYDALIGMKYLDMVLNESMRKWPVSVALDRVCTKPYSIPPKLPGEGVLHIEKGTTVLIPMIGIQRDPKYYPDPEKFDPERFSSENKGKIQPYTFMIFGFGPRTCIGARFAIMEIKVLFFSILREFEIVPVEKTPIPMRFRRDQITMSAEDGFWFGFKKRVGA